MAGDTRSEHCIDVVPAKSGQVDNLATLANKYGEWYQYFNGVDLTISLRTSDFTIQGGTSTGQNVADNCDVRANLPELNAGIGAGLVGSTVSTTSPYCHVAYGWLTQVRGLGTYTIPKIDTQVSAVFQSKPGALLVGKLRDAGCSNCDHTSQCCGRGGFPRTSAVRERPERDDQPDRAGFAVRRSHQPARLPLREELQVRRQAGDGRRSTCTTR